MAEWKKMSEIQEEVFNIYNELYDKLKGMSFERAYKELDGFCLDADAYYDTAKEKMKVSLKFDVNYKNVITTIFACGENNDICELWECCFYKLGEHCEISFDVAAHHSIKQYAVYIDNDYVVQLK